ncbi:MAG TPA: GNAT family N-acetyltransferase [Chlamydiales bacterium]|nr:GNAT family N-acetyltransferase [Chlamydiales bacterium]
MPIPSTHTYSGATSKIDFSSQEGDLFITIETSRLLIRTVNQGDHRLYAALFGDKDVMEKYANGATKTENEMAKRINDIWVKRLHENDPYVGMAVFRKDTSEFIGHIILGHGDHPGESEIAYLFHKAHWGNGYGSEAISALVTEFAPATVKEGFTLEGKKLEKIVATSRPDNIASKRILEKLGMHLTGEEIKYGAKRFHYAISLSEIVEKSSQKTTECWYNSLTWWKSLIAC